MNDAARLAQNAAKLSLVATVVVGDVAATGEGTSKKQAEMAAALEAWSLLSSMHA